MYGSNVWQQCMAAMYSSNVWQQCMAAMYGSNVFNFVSNKAIINETLAFIKRSGRFKKLEAFN